MDLGILTERPVFGPGHNVLSWRDITLAGDCLRMSCSCGWRAEFWDRFFLDTDMPASLLVYYHSECC